MNAHAKGIRQANNSNRLSYCSQEPALRLGMPVSLRRLRALRTTFDHNRDPYISAQLKAASQTEAKRREESGKGSMMIKLHQPFPTLRPKHEKSMLRASFNRAWLREQRSAFLFNRRAERFHQQQNSHVPKRVNNAPQRQR
ncbi:MAG: hypothetical protein QM500_15940 [Methylococcales bacterium]